MVGRCGGHLPQAVLGVLHKGGGGHRSKSGDDDEGGVYEHNSQ